MNAVWGSATKQQRQADNQLTCLTRKQRNVTLKIPVYRPAYISEVKFGRKIVGKGNLGSDGRLWREASCGLVYRTTLSI